MSAPGTDWHKAGRDAAHEDATYEDAVPCTTLDGARTRCAVWLEDVEGADVEAAAAGYLAGWTAHLLDAADTSALPLDLGAIERRILAAPSCDCGSPSTQWCADSECEAESCDGHARQTGALGHDHRWTRYPIATEDAVALAAEVRRLRALLDTAAQAYDDIVARVWRAAGETHEPPANVEALVARVAAARHDGAEAMRGAIVTALDAMVRAEATEAELFRLTRDEDSAAEHHHKRAVLLEARVTVLGLPLPEVTP